MITSRSFSSASEAERVAFTYLAALSGLPLEVSSAEGTKLTITVKENAKVLTSMEDICAYFDKYLSLVDDDDASCISSEAVLTACRSCEDKSLVSATNNEVLVGILDAVPGSSLTLPSLMEELSVVDNDVVRKLNELGVKYDIINHDAIVTAEDLVANVKLDDATMVHTKNLFLKDKKHGLFLVCLNAHSGNEINGSKVSKIIGKALGLTGKVNMRMPDEATLLETLKCEKGCLGGLNTLLVDDRSSIKVVVDAALVENDGVSTIYSHPADNTMSVGLSVADYVNTIGEHEVVDFTVDLTTSNDTSDKNKKGSKQKSQANKKKTTAAGQTLLALQWKKNENFAQWYSDVIVLSEMIAYYDISGCYILRPWSYKIWESIQGYMNNIIETRLKTENCYFPLFVSRERLEKEKDHIEGFAPEVAWVTHSGESKLQVPIAIRPTSETIMYPTFSNLIQSHRDLPLCINQWSNVVRWEFKDPTPFLRSREFLWQEGHTAHSTHEESTVMVRDALEMYRETYEDLLCVPVIPGYKTEKEKFAGGHMTTTVEAYIPVSGRAIQGATSHDLGQNFGKMFDITFQSKDKKSETVWQTSWGFTTRSIGVMVMVHGDDKGLVLPPTVSPLQVVIIPIHNKKTPLSEISPYCEEILSKLKAAGLRADYDDRTTYNPGWKYNHWEQKGVPIRLEVGPSDLANTTARVVIRHSGDKEDVAVTDGFEGVIQSKLDEIQKAMFTKAKEVRDAHIVQVTEWKDFVPALEGNNLVLSPWCGGEHQEWEEWVKNTSRAESLERQGVEEESETTATSVAAKTLCIPFDQPELPEGTKCIASGMDATCWVLWGRSY